MCQDGQGHKLRFGYSRWHSWLLFFLTTEAMTFNDNHKYVVNANANVMDS